MNGTRAQMTSLNELQPSDPSNDQQTFPMTKILIALFDFGWSLPLVAQQSSVAFKKHRLTSEFWAEGAYFGDFNNDGEPDFVYGPYLFYGKSFATKTEYRAASQSYKTKSGDGSEVVILGFEGPFGTNNAYSDSFLTDVHDFNVDGSQDITVCGFPWKEAIW